MCTIYRARLPQGKNCRPIKSRFFIFPSGGVKEKQFGISFEDEAWPTRILVKSVMTERVSPRQPEQVPEMTH